MGARGSPYNLTLGLCPPCKRGDHAECWHYAPPPSIPAQRCPCPVERQRFMLRAQNHPQGGPGWVVWDFWEDHEFGGWYADVVKGAAEEFARLANEGQVAFLPGGGSG